MYVTFYDNRFSSWDVDAEQTNKQPHFHIYYISKNFTAYTYRQQLYSIAVTSVTHRSINKNCHSKHRATWPRISREAVVKVST